MLNFEDVYETYAPGVYRFAFWLAGDRFEAEDITSETFARAWASPAPIRTKTLKAYLFAIARNTYRERHRKWKREVDLSDAQPSPAPGPEEVAAQRLELQEVRRLLQTLPEVDRAAFIMRVDQGLPYAEIARALDLSLSAAKVKVHRVRRRLLAARIGKEGI
jgi:RNA polymerase sigma-70 factor (ECF subfamily)